MIGWSKVFGGNQLNQLRKEVRAFVRFAEVKHGDRILVASADSHVASEEFDMYKTKDDCQTACTAKVFLRLVLCCC